MIDEKEIMQLGRIDLINFSILTNPNYVPNWHHLLIADYLEKAEIGEIKRLIIQMPPRSGKSQLASINFPAWYLGRNTNKEIITSSYSGDLAIDFGQKTRDLVRDEAYKAIFPELELREDSQAKNKWLTKQGGSYISMGVGGALTGRGANCFPAGTIITTDRGKEKIENCNKGTRVLSYDHDKNILEFKKVKATLKRVGKRFIKITTNSGRVIISTDDHKIFVVGKGYIEAKNIREKEGLWILPLSKNGNIVMLSLQERVCKRLGRIYKTGSCLQEMPYNSSQIKEDTILSITSFEKELDVYDIQVEDNNNFFANDILVHNCLLIDDPIKNREEANSETMRKKTWEWFTSTAFTRLSPDGVVIIIQTRWHQDDLAGRIQEMDDDNQWTVLSLPAIAEKDERYIIKGRTYERKEGEALWPERYSLEETLKIKKQIGVYDFSCLYQQNAINEENQLFKKEWFTYYEEADIINKDLEVYVAVDLAGWEESVSDDNTSIQVVGKESGSNIIYKLEDFTGRFNPTEVIDNLFYLKDKYKLKLIAVGIETNGYQKSLEFFLKQEMDKRGKRFNVIPLVGKTKKELRIKGLIPFYESRLIKHRSNGMDNALEDELLVFPFGKHDDRIDALAYMLQVMEHTKNPEKKRSFIPDYNKLY